MKTAVPSVTETKTANQAENPNKKVGGEQIPEKTPEVKLDEARTIYTDAYKAALNSKKSKENWIKRQIGKVFGQELKEKEIPPELKTLKEKYDQSLVDYGNSLYNAKQKELEGKGLTGAALSAELNKYKSTEIFTKVIINEQSLLSAEKIESFPPKEKGNVRKALDWYLKQPKWKKVALSTLLATGAVAAFSGATVAAGGGALAYAGTRFARGFAGGTLGKLAAQAYDWINPSKGKKVKEGIYVQFFE